MRWVACIEYDGSDYSGWQSQPHAPSVQDTLEAALSRVADTFVRTVCSGRTDSGVHAQGQIVHFDTTVERRERAWVLGTNRYLPDDIAVQWCRPVPDTFHARFGAFATPEWGTTKASENYERRFKLTFPNETLPGDVDVEVLLNPKGHEPLGINAKLPRQVDKSSLRECLRGAVAAAAYPSYDGPPVVVNFSFELDPGTYWEEE